MTDEFFEHHFGKFVFGKFFVRIHQEIKKFCMFAGFAANAHCVMADDDCKNGSYGKFKGTESKLESGNDRKGRNGCGMSAGHTAIAEKTGKIPGFVDNGIDYYLQHLCNSPGNNGSEKKFICEKDQRLCYRSR